MHMSNLVNSINNRIKTYMNKLSHTTLYLIGSIRGNPVRTFWFRSVPNFGDLLNPIIFRYYGYFPVNTYLSTSDVLCLGSILNWVPETYSGIIIGSGLITDEIHPLPQAKIIAVRGELTKERIGAPKDIVLGDPGLLVPLLFPNRSKKEFLLGFVPHYTDKNNIIFNNIQNRYSKEIKLIDVQQEPKEVVSEIDSCNFILSSSLHGLITADSLNIPNGWIEISNNVTGEGFKFRDYSSAFNRTIKPNKITGRENLTQLINLTNKVSESVNEAQHNLDLAFKKLSTFL